MRNLLNNLGDSSNHEPTTRDADDAVDNDDDDDTTITVVSCATGTKCTAVPAHTLHADAILHDSHAEVLARRGLVRVLWQEIIMHNNNNKDATLLLAQVPNSSHCYQLRENVQLHLYVSDSPCGDASIYSLDASSAPTNHDDDINDNNNDNNNGLQFTGAKVIVSPATNVSLHDCGGQQAGVGLLDNSRVARERIQLLGRLRIKSGRSNLRPDQRSDSLSCSDKMVRWSVLGLQGRALLPYLNNEPIRLSSVIVSRDIRNHSDTTTGAQFQALQRAMPDRVMAVKEELCKENGVDGNTTQKSSSVLAHEVDAIHVPQVHVVEQVFAPGKACSEHAKEMASRKRKHGGGGKPKLSPTGVCLNWNMYDDSVELTVGARGIRQGKQPKTGQDILTLASRLSRQGIWKIARDVCSAVSYAEAKSSETRQRDWRGIIFHRGPLAGWLVGGDQDSPTENEALPPKSDTT